MATKTHEATGQFKGLRELTPELAKKIQDAFGSCTIMFECETVPELVADFNELVAENKGADLQYWLILWLSAEECDGASEKALEEIRTALAAIEQ